MSDIAHTFDLHKDSSEEDIRRLLIGGNRVRFQNDGYDLVLSVRPDGTLMALDNVHGRNWNCGPVDDFGLLMTMLAKWFAKSDRLIAAQEKLCYGSNPGSDQLWVDFGVIR